MITKEKLKIYKLYGGNIDGWVHVRTGDEKNLIDDDDWCLIESFIQDILLEKKGLASEVYLKRVNDQMRAACDSEDTMKALEQLAMSFT